MKSFGERNPIVIAVIGLIALAAVAVATFYSEDLPVVGGGTTYAANFTEASGLKAGDDVSIAGVRVGKVDSITLVDRHVRVEFRVKGAWIGDASTAHIKIKTLLGQEFVEIDPEGTHPLSSSTPIPVKRTTTPLDVSAALSGLSDTSGQIDTTQLAKSFDTLSATFHDTPRSVRTALTGLSRISKTIASRDTELRKLARNTADLTDTLSGSDANIAKLIDDGNLLLQELRRRSAAITALLDGTRDLSRQIAGLVRDNDKTLGPALTQLTKVTDILTDNRSHLDEALRLIGPYYSLLDNAAGNGPWIDIYLCGLFDKSGAPILNATAKRNCQPSAGK